MSRSKRSGLAVGALLVLAGLALLMVQLVPGLRFVFSWPMIIVGVGVFLFLLGLLTGEPGMAIPACIVGGIGCILYWQNATENWESWSFVWALIPGFVGVGTMISGLLAGKGKDVRGGAWLALISLVMFAAAASFFGALGFLGRYWPVLLILLGLMSLVQTLFRRR